jgi:hypothetical protein
VFRAFRDVETLIQFTDGWLVYYNYFRSHTSLDGKTPAEEANVNYSVKNWNDLVRVPVSKEAEIKTHKEPVIRLPKTKVDLTKAFKRRRGSNPRGDTHLSHNWREERRLTNGISSKAHNVSINPHWVAPHRTKGGGITRRSDR